MRHHRQRGEDTFFLTGVDEHAIEGRAGGRRSRGSTPQEYVDRIVERVAGAARAPRRVERLLHPDDATTGTSAFVQEFLQRIYDNGDVYQDVYAGLYCVGCEAFKTEDELVDGKCPEHGIEPEWIEEKNWFFRLSAYQDALLALYDERPDFVLPGVPRQRGAELHRGRAAGLLDQPRRRSPGASRSRGIRSRSPTSGPTRSSTT